MSLYIVRGLPGAGKSTFARELAMKWGFIHIEPDMFCYRHGAYVYTETRYMQAKALAMRLLYQIGNNVLRPDVVFADVCPTISDINAVESAYCEKATKIYTLEIDLETARRRNAHGVAENDLQQMASSFQDIPYKTAVKVYTLEIGLETARCPNTHGVQESDLQAMDELIYEPIDE